MWTDPIVDELHRFREAHAARFNNDLRAIAVELRKIEQDWPAPTIDPPPKPPAGRPTPPPSFRAMATRDVIGEA